ncbi:hypothetical protein P153DRAFT_294223 [Dothidotthia symphoricarpi CBS 119687]|uniref:Uncharacterized protein n=1 Tax=Dothidotthia symphoricarpi CBS 119687 TaxID=1392245 RepID=A0A6A6A8G4_9PLEO|nr:uncharacterized protein P153DRAFT_294223 [Dothidotthia symphoricarpi CBS 119687]KAF2128130.1 hypothetical protein P153DRAFT_294223 [Dothidotthia symphoricarpi CBS 119687]
MDRTDMAAYFPHLPSPRGNDSPSPQMYSPDPITPIHSPHHSVHSSVSLRASLHTLSLHEYRKQQNTPESRTGTPAGKTLRRKAAAPALNEIERAPSVTHSRRSGPPSSSRPLQASQSAQQLFSHPAPSRQVLLDQAFRSQSAEPSAQSYGIPSTLNTNLPLRVHNFGSRKRLPRPLEAKGGSNLYPPPLAIVCTTQPRRSVLPATSSFSKENTYSSDALTTPTPSTFSLSKFPHPPHLQDPSFSPPPEENGPTRLNALSFASTAPATPPATPAVIHYRGASFDLVNPRESLLLHDIVTPSRDFESSEFLLVQSPDESLALSPEMAPRRALYRDLNSAHASIRKCTEDSLGASNLDLPLPPVPVAVSPGSSSYSPLYSPESNFAPSALAVKKVPNESRFSLKQLTRSLTKKLGRSSDKQNGEELQDFEPRVDIASTSVDGDFHRAFNHTYVTTPQASYFPIGPTSPISPTSPESLQDLGVLPDEDGEIEFPRRFSPQYYDSEPLMSMVPDNPSTQMGRMDDQRASISDGDLYSKPYYETSIYASSSVYTGDDRRRSNYQQSSYSNQQSNPYIHYSGADANSFADEYNRDSLYGYSSPRRTSRRVSRPLAQEMFHRSVVQADDKTDTISKFIDRYDPGDITSNSLSTKERFVDAYGPDKSGSGAFEDVSSDYQPQPIRSVSGVNHYEFGLSHNVQDQYSDGTVSSVHVVPATRPTVTQEPGLPPQAPVPPTPEHHAPTYVLPRPEFSEMFSNGSFKSYGDTRNLLQISQSDVEVPQVSRQGLQPSSSYSQAEARALEPSSSYSQADGEASPQTPQAALDQAEQIFQNAVTDRKQNEQGIPLMWTRRTSGNLLLHRKHSNDHPGDKRESGLGAGFSNSVAEERADWETIAGTSQRGRTSLDSIADYSSSEGSRNSLSLNSDGSPPSWAKQSHSRGPSHYSHPSPLRAEHAHPFSSSPPSLMARSAVRTAPEAPTSPMGSSPPGSSTVPAFRSLTRSANTVGKGAVEEPYAFTPWVDPYAFSDKETQELLASGPNDDIIIQDELNASRRSQHLMNPYLHDQALMSSSPDSRYGNTKHDRENSFEKFSVVGPKGNLTGTPKGTGMHETGSSIADTSSPGARLSSSVGRSSVRSDYHGFYASPFPATGSVTRIRTSLPAPEPDHEQTPSRTTTSPHTYNSQSVQETSPLTGVGHRQSLRNSTEFQRARRTSRAAVPGQTKLRHMFLAPDSRATLSSQDSNHSRFLATRTTERPSTSDTNTPLRPCFSVDTHATVQSAVAHHHSPHLLCPERKSDPEDEARRRQLSWFIFAAFCLFPPCIILHRFYGNSIMVWCTKGHLGHCTPQSHRAALIAGIAVNVILVTGILVPILVAHALKAL